MYKYKYLKYKKKYLDFKNTYNKNNKIILKGSYTNKIKLLSNNKDPYKQKYLKYKFKYHELKTIVGGSGRARQLPLCSICKKGGIVSACIAGSCFVFQGKHNSVLINYSI